MGGGRRCLHKKAPWTQKRVFFMKRKIVPLLKREKLNRHPPVKSAIEARKKVFYHKKGNECKNKQERGADRCTIGSKAGKNMKRGGATSGAVGPIKIQGQKVDGAIRKKTRNWGGEGLF